MHDFRGELPHEPITCEALPGLEFFLVGDREGIHVVAQDPSGRAHTITTLSRWGKMIRGTKIPGDFPHIPGTDTYGSLPIAFPGEAEGGGPRRNRTSKLRLRNGLEIYIEADNGRDPYIKYYNPDHELTYIYGVISQDGFYRWAATPGDRETQIPGIAYDTDGSVHIQNPFTPTMQEVAKPKTKAGGKPKKPIRETPMRERQADAQVYLQRLECIDMPPAIGHAQPPMHQLDEANRDQEEVRPLGVAQDRWAWEGQVADRYREAMYAHRDAGGQDFVRAEPLPLTELEVHELDRAVARLMEIQAARNEPADPPIQERVQNEMDVPPPEQPPIDLPNEEDLAEDVFHDELERGDIDEDDGMF